MISCENCKFAIVDGIQTGCSFNNRIGKINEKYGEVKDKEGKYFLTHWCNAKTNEDLSYEYVREKIKVGITVIVRNGEYEDQIKTVNSLPDYPYKLFIVSGNPTILSQKNMPGFYVQPIYETYSEHTVDNIIKKNPNDYYIVLNAGDILKEGLLERVDELINDDMGILLLAFEGENYIVNKTIHYNLIGSLEKPIRQKAEELDVPFYHSFDL